MLIYKIFRAAEWASLQKLGSTRGAPVDIADGYVHFSTAKQLPVTLSKHFSGEDGLMLLACEADMMGAQLRWEVSRGGEDFPHLYRDLRVNDILWSRPVKLTSEGHDTGMLE